jgi:hypothetical protein
MRWPQVTQKRRLRLLLLPQRAHTTGSRVSRSRRAKCISGAAGLARGRSPLGSGRATGAGDARNTGAGTVVANGASGADWRARTPAGGVGDATRAASLWPHSWQ